MMVDFTNTLGVLAVALLLDFLFGEPERIWRRIPHPVVLIGQLVAKADLKFNRMDEPTDMRRKRGMYVIAALVGGALLLGWLIQVTLLILPFGWLILALLASTLIAQKSLAEHVIAVADALEGGGIVKGRETVAQIVGRDPEMLSEGGVSRAAIESCAENFSDGVVAPIFWFAVLGLGGLLAYKAINTADSMIGHRTERHEAFGMASARVDDAVNWIPARLAAFLIAVAAPFAGQSISGAVRAAISDAEKHKSVNAGWPEAAMAGALGIALAGPRVYKGVVTEDPYLNDAGRKNANSDDIRASVPLMRTACILQAVLVVAVWLAT